ncbi:MAG: alpha/beta hydrolase-fold protein [Bacteroidales bacterium]|nr:alpha/beta hydrolase-fold protein [Bacteroidales bacterium]
MKKTKYFLIIATTLFFLYGNKLLSQIELYNNQLDTTDIVIGKRHMIHSEVLGENREIFIHVPIEDRTDFDTVHYPVVYVFDGSSQFLSIVDLMNRLSTSLGDEICPKMIVVGINHNDREKDLGLEHDIEGNLTSNSLIHDKFTEFIEKELQPYVEANFHTLPYRILIGYSLGGLKAMNIIAYNTQLFNAYVVIDPSIGHYDNQWYNNSILRIEEADLSNKSIFLAMAQTMKMGTDTNETIKDTTTDSRHMRNIMEAADMFRKNRSSFSFTWKYYPDEYHGSVPLIAEYDAFKNIFDWYNLQKLRYIFKSDDSPLSIKEVIKEHFEKTSQKIGMLFLPPEYYLANLVIYFYSTDKWDKAFAVSELLIENYPNSQFAINTQQILLNEQQLKNNSR